MLGRKILIVTDHKALVSLLNTHNKKNKTMFSRLTRWLDRLIPFDFQVEHKPGAKIAFTDYLSRHPSSDAKPVSIYDSMFTVAKIDQIRSALGFKKKIFSKGRLESPKTNNIKRVCNISDIKQPVAIDHAVDNGPITERRIAFPAGQLSLVKIQLRLLLRQILVPQTQVQTFNIQNPILINERKIKKLLERHPSISRSDEIEDIDQDMQAVTTETGALRVTPLFPFLRFIPAKVIHRLIRKIALCRLFREIAKWLVNKPPFQNCLIFDLLNRSIVQILNSKQSLK